jgi:two-component system, NarL family, nitrate/nitrite response regulator NarL
MQEPVVGKINVILIDQYPLIRAGLRLLIEQNPEMVVVAETGDAFDAIELISRLNPDIILLSSIQNEGSCVEMIPKFVSICLDSQLIMLLGSDQSAEVLRAFQNGALGIVLKSQSPDVLIKAIHKVHLGEVWIERSKMASLLSSIPRKHQPALTRAELERMNLLSKREREVVAMIGRMMKNQQIADQLGISEVTVRHHLTSIYSKLQVTGRLELLVLTQRHGPTNFAGFSESN